MMWEKILWGQAKPIEGIFMELDPTFYLWNPTLKQGSDALSIVTLNITPGASDRLINRPQSFFIQILNDIGIVAKPKSWDILIYRSNYHGERDKNKDWREQWPKNWRVSISLSETLSVLPLLRDEYTETYASGLVINKPEDELMIGCMIIADFQNEKTLNNARSAINQSYDIKRLAMEISASTPKFYCIRLGQMFFQMQIYLSKFNESFFNTGAPYALAIEDICRKANGITSFDQRANEWGELYNPAGLE